MIPRAPAVPAWRTIRPSRAEALPIDNDPANADAEGGFMGHGGQSDNRYYGDGEPFADGAAERDNAVTEDQS
jgi:hypothetical protein